MVSSRQLLISRRFLYNSKLDLSLSFGTIYKFNFSLMYIMNLEKQNFFTLNLILPNNQLAPQNMMPISSVVKGDHSAYFTIVH